MHIKNQQHIYRQCRRSWYCDTNVQFVRTYGNYSMVSESLWNDYRDNINDDENENNDECNKEYNTKIIKSMSFENKTKIVRSTSDNASRLNAETVVNFWRSLDLLWLTVK